MFSRREMVEQKKRETASSFTALLRRRQRRLIRETFDCWSTCARVCAPSGRDRSSGSAPHQVYVRIYIELYRACVRPNLVHILVLRKDLKTAGVS